MELILHSKVIIVAFLNVISLFCLACVGSGLLLSALLIVKATRQGD